MISSFVNASSFTVRALVGYSKGQGMDLGSCSEDRINVDYRMYGKNGALEGELFGCGAVSGAETNGTWSYAVKPSS